MNSLIAVKEYKLIKFHTISLMSIIVQILSLIVTIFVAIFGIYKYLRHERKQSIQQYNINNHLLNEKKEEEKAKLCADISVKLIYGDKGKATLICTNKGKSKAENIRFEVTKGIENFVLLKIHNLEYLEAGNEITFSAIMSDTGSDTIQIKSVWDDAHKINNEKLEII